MNRAVFLDRDGVINAAIATADGLDSPRSIDEFSLLSGVGVAIRKLNESGIRAIVVSNQPGIAKGKLDSSALQAITETMTRQLAAEGAVLDGIYYCLHHPDAVRADYQAVCDCRKPKPGLLVQAARDHGVTLAGSYMVGDQVRDITAGKAAGCTTVFIGSDENARSAEADYFANDLSSAIVQILDLELATQASGGS